MKRQVFRIVFSFHLQLCIIVFLTLAPSDLTAAPESSYLVRLDGKAYKYLLKSALEKKYFADALGWTYTYAVEGTAPPDTPAVRKEIARRLLPAYLNYRVATAKFENMVKLRRGYCIQGLMIATGDEAAAAYAVDFLVKGGSISGFIVGAAHPCSMMPKPIK